MRRDLRHYICMGLAVTAVLAGVAGCASENKKSSKQDDTEDTTAVKVQESSEPEETTVQYDITQPSDLEESGNIGGIDYELSPANAYGDLDDRGYYVFDDPSDPLPYILVITSGEHSTGGYDIEIVDLQYDGSELTVVVKETSPGPEDIVTEAFTYPCCGVKLSLLPDSVCVKNIAGVEFEELAVSLSDNNIDDGWIACLEDGAGEIIEKTYVYELADGTYKYINVESITASWGSTQWNDTVKGSGIVDTRDDIIKVAEDFGSCGWVLLPGDYSTAYSIEEFVSGTIFG